MKQERIEFQTSTKRKAKVRAHCAEKEITLTAFFEGCIDKLPTIKKEGE